MGGGRSSSGSAVVDGAGIRRRLLALGHAVIAGNLGHAQPVVLEHRAAADGLGRAVLAQAAPLGQRRLVAPDRQRQDLAGLGQALEPLDRDEPVDVGQMAAQLGRHVEIVPAVLGERPDLENDGDQKSPPFFFFSCTAWPRLAETIPRLTPSQPISPNRRPYSIFGQRSMTTSAPAALARSAAASSRTPSCIQTTGIPSRTAWSAPAPASLERRKIDTMSGTRGRLARSG